MPKIRNILLELENSAGHGITSNRMQILTLYQFKHHHDSIGDDDGNNTYYFDETCLGGD